MKHRAAISSRWHFMAATLATILFVGVIGWFALDKASSTPDDNKSETAQDNRSQEPAGDGQNQEGDAPTNLIKVPELGVQFYVDDTLADIEYVVTDKNTDSYKSKVANFSTKKLAAASANCTAANAPLGSLGKTEGAFPSEPNYTNTNGNMLNQFDGYYVSYLWPASTCYTNVDTEKMVQDQRSAFRQALYGVMPLN